MSRFYRHSDLKTPHSELSLMLQKLQIYVNWLVPILLGSSLYCIIYISGHFEPEIFTWKAPLAFSIIIAILFFLVRKFLNARFQKQREQILNWKNFLLAFLIVEIAFLVIYLILKTVIIQVSSQTGSIGKWHLLLVVALGTIFGLIIVGTQLMILFFKGWSESKLKMEQLEKETTKARLASLKLQLNPHFLFNNFHTLNGLIHEDQEEASNFLMELANLYRSILSYSADEIISLQQELDLVQHFNFLMNKRFVSNYECVIQVSEQCKQNYFLPPLSIQLLLENAVKHNRIDDEHPLKCIITEKGSFLEVVNKISPKAQTQKTSGIGIKNLKMRYQLLSDLPITVFRNTKIFSVKIPLLKVETEETNKKIDNKVSLFKS